jgi:hypothetical protein
MRPLLILGLLLLCQQASATPYLPADDGEVLLRVTPRSDPALSELRNAREALDLDPGDLGLATAYARMAIAMGRQQADPRWYGYAQAALQPWWSLPEPPSEVRVLRATLAQNRHAFRAAIDDLDAVIANDPQHLQARLTRAVIHSVQGRYELARRDCGALLGAGPLLTVSCIANAASLGGSAEATWRALDSALGLQAADTDDALQLWALTLRAELAERLGRDDTEHHFLAALAAPGGKSDRYLLAAYADWLNDQQRASDVLRLIDPSEDSDGLLLRRAIARAQLLDAGDASQRGPLREEIRTLEQRFAAEQARGGLLHRREAAMLALRVQGDIETALWLARENFREQREPLDARLLLAAALAAAEPAAAAEAVAWFKEHNIEDVRLQPIVDALLRLAATP